MALSDVIGKLFSTQFIAGVKQVTPYVAYARDRSAEIQQMGDGLIVGVAQGLVSVADYPDSADITYAELSPSKIELTVDKEKYVAFKIEDTKRRQASFDVFSEAIRQSVREFAGQVSADYRTALAAQTVDNAHTVGVGLTLASPTAAQRVSLHLGIYDITAALKTLGFEQRPVVMVHPAIYKQLIQYATVETSVALPAISQRAFADAILSPIYGADIVPDWGAANPGTLSATADCYAFIPGSTLVYASQLSVPEQLRAQGRFATEYRSLNTYGLGVEDDRTLFKLDITAA